MHWIYAHLIGDYILQTHWMASGKKRSYLICLIHVLTYMLPFLFTGLSLLQLTLIGLQHYIQDKTNFVTWFMDVKGSSLFAQPPFAPMSIIIMDNVLHILFMAMIASLSI